jgi:hypothetical protein
MEFHRLSPAFYDDYKSCPEILTKRPSEKRLWRPNDSKIAAIFLRSGGQG